MRKTNLFFIFLIILTLTTFALAQGRSYTKTGSRPDKQRIRIFRELGLSKQQIQQIREINKETRPHKKAANLAFRQARKELDQAIYADEVNEDDVKTRLRSMTEAHAVVTRINAMHELRVRGILTQTQLIRFREFRRKFAERRRKRAARRNRHSKRRMLKDKPARNKQKKDQPQ